MDVCNVRSMILDCSWALTPLEAMLSCLHIFCRSLFSSVLQCWISMGAICCRLDEAMVVVCDYASRKLCLGRVSSLGAGGVLPLAVARGRHGASYTRGQRGL